MATAAADDEITSMTTPRRLHVRDWQTRRSTRSKVLKRPTSFLYPALLCYGIFFVAPNVLAFYLSFTNWSTYHDGYKFVGLDNFRSLFNQGDLGQSIRITILYALIVVVVENVLGLALALALERPTRIHQAIRIIVFFPVFLAPLAAGYAFKGVLQPTGPINTALGYLVGHPVRIAWLADFNWAIVAVALIQVWKFLGFNMMVYLAGLSGISPDIVAAARVDGASGFALFRYIKFPLLAPAVTISVVLGFIGSLSAFDIIIATTQGGPGTATTVLNVYVWISYVAGALGQATAVSLTLLVLIIVLGLPVIIALRQRERLQDAR